MELHYLSWKRFVCPCSSHSGSCLAHPSGAAAHTGAALVPGEQGGPTALCCVDAVCSQLRPAIKWKGRAEHGVDLATPRVVPCDCRLGPTRTASKMATECGCHNMGVLDSSHRGVAGVCVSLRTGGYTATATASSRLSLPLNVFYPQ